MQFTSTKYPVPTVLATEIITAAWLTYERLGLTNRPRKELVNDPIMCEDESDREHYGLVIVPSLHNTVVENILCALQPAQSMPTLHLEITDEIRAAAAADADLIRQTAMFRLLQDKVENFLQSLGKDLNQSELTMGDIKRLCYMPGVAQQIREGDTNEQLLLRARRDHLSQVGHTVKVTVTVMTQRYQREWNTYNHLAITDEGHAVSFFLKQPQSCMSRITIEGRIKSHDRMWKRPDIAETRMNYVRCVA
jgi:hypothetical protein